MDINLLKKYFVFLLIFLGSFNIAHASLEITEIMYAPEGGSDYEWVEIFNNGTSPIDLNKSRFFHGQTISGPITLKVGDSSVLQPSKYAIISKSLTDYSWLNFSNMVFSSSVLSLPDSGDNTYIAISDPDKNIIDEVTYDITKGGSKISKTSLSKINGSWLGASPTPGAVNVSPLKAEDSISNDIVNIPISISSSNQNSNTQVSSDNYAGEYKITAKIISPKIITAKLPFYISSLTTTNKRETLAVGRYVWNFGDGTSSEMKSQQEFEHTYDYPGEYVLTLSFFNTYFDKTPSATNRLIIKVVSADISISSVGQSPDSFIEFENKSNYEVDISGFIVKTNTQNFIIPNGTVILPNHKIKLSSKVTGFADSDLNSIIVTNQTGEVITIYPKKELSILDNRISNNISFPVGGSSNNQIKNINTNNSVINLNDLVAQAQNNEYPITDSSKSFYFWFGLLGIITIGITVVIITRRKVETSDYIEQEIRAEDIKIIE